MFEDFHKVFPCDLRECYTSTSGRTIFNLYIISKLIPKSAIAHMESMRFATNTSVNDRYALATSFISILGWQDHDR